jgi:predicted 2-oxoglutarate/Fe(II)-dependent dioxygenase YbiX
VSILQKYTDIKIDKNFNKIHDEAYVYHNFLSNKECREIVNYLKNLKEWDSPHSTKNKMLAQYNDRLKNLFFGKTFINNLEEIQRRSINEGHSLHIDIPNYANELLYMVTDKKNIEIMNISMGIYGFIIYFNDDYEGGEICYPEYGIDYKPKQGDLLIHSTESIHGVSKVKSGIRYTTSSVVSGFFNVDSEKYKNFKEPESRFNLLNEDYFTFVFQPSKNHRMQQFQKTYTHTGKFDEEYNPNNPGLVT